MRNQNLNSLPSILVIPLFMRIDPYAFASTCLFLLLIGCGTQGNYRSTDFSGDRVYKKGSEPSPQLSENEVLDLKPSDSVTDEDIRRILDQTRSFQLKSGSRLLLVQSGAIHPDKAMVEELSPHFTVVPHTGVPSDLRQEDFESAVSKALRLAAAHSNAETILVYWGHLEMKRNDLVTSIVSWVPVIDFTVPDEYQKVRMFLKVALIDVRTGQWATFQT
jgi:hypothetical protein